LAYNDFFFGLGQALCSADKIGVDIDSGLLSVTDIVENKAFDRHALSNVIDDDSYAKSMLASKDMLEQCRLAAALHIKSVGEHDDSGKSALPRNPKAA
jgi:hypothetical protein